MEWEKLVCDDCEHKGEFGCCKAFPDGISGVVIETNKHNKPIKGQVGNYVYTPKKDDKK